MEAKPSKAHGGFGSDPHGPTQTHEAQQSQEPPEGGYRPQLPEERQRSHPHPHHHLRLHYGRPLFYMQPPQPYLPLQWPMPMPMPFDPYGGPPGMGYGVVMPPFQLRPCPEPPSFILPYCRQHLTDYRPLTSRYCQTMAFHTRRVHYQDNSPTKEMVTSEVQTDPLAASHLPGDGSSKRILSNTIRTPRSKFISTASTRTEDKSLAGKATGRVSSVPRVVPKSSFMLQTDEVRIECCSSPRGLKILHSHQTTELARHVSDRTLQGSSALRRGLETQKEQNLQTFPNIPQAGVLTCDGSTGLEDCGPHTIKGLKAASPCEAAEVTYEMLVHSDAVVTGSVAEQRKILQLPFDMQDLDKLRRMESSVWSVESVAPSCEWTSQHGLIQTQEHPLNPTVTCPMADEVSVGEEVSVEEVIQMTEMGPMIEVPVAQLVSVEETAPIAGDPVVEEVSVREAIPTVGVPVSQSPPVVNVLPTPPEMNQLTQEMNELDQHETSFESLPAYLHSPSWLAESENIYYYSKFPPRVHEQHRTISGYPADLSRKRGVVKPQPQDHLRVLGSKGREFGHAAKMDRRSVSDNECCTDRNRTAQKAQNNRKPFVPSNCKLERFCARCLTKRKALASVPEAPRIKSKEVPVSLWDEALASCRCQPRKRTAGSLNISAVHKEHHTEGESSENSSCRIRHKPKRLEDPVRVPEPRRPLSTRTQVQGSPVGLHAKVQDKRCSCQAHQHLHAPWEGPRRHRSSTRENNENQAVPLQNRWRSVDPRYLGPKWRT